jgi:hypothetical protein
MSTRAVEMLRRDQAQGVAPADPAQAVADGPDWGGVFWGENG